MLACLSASFRYSVSLSRSEGSRCSLCIDDRDKRELVIAFPVSLSGVRFLLFVAATVYSHSFAPDESMAFPFPSLPVPWFLSCWGLHFSC